MKIARGNRFSKLGGDTGRSKIAVKETIKAIRNAVQGVDWTLNQGQHAEVGHASQLMASLCNDLVPPHSPAQILVPTKPVRGRWECELGPLVRTHPMQSRRAPALRESS